MLKFETCTKNNHQKSILLSKKIFKDNMDQQFLLLFGDENRKHMFIATDENKVVSMVNYYKSSVNIYESQILVASIGSVCTLDEYRHQSIASNLLIMAERKMISESVSVAIISGDGGLYHQFGADVVGDMIGYVFTRNDMISQNEYTIKLYDDSQLDPLMILYEQEDIRYLRTKSEFKKLILGQTYPDTFADYPFYLIYENNVLVAYVIFSRAFGKRTLLIKEFGGKREALVKSFGTLLVLMKKLSLTIICSPNDGINEWLHTSRSKRTSLHASIKIVNPSQLLKDLTPYLIKICGEDRWKHLSFIQNGDRFRFQYKNEQPCELDIHELNRLIFESPKSIVNQIKSESLKTLLKTMFPIPFVWVNNLNYQ
ncbi:MAG: GNAT family N-acetyltransferase [Firmicutes bacterium]|nr:GNAT family N-acetyltransferase [Bacillota bacterium]